MIDYHQPIQLIGTVTRDTGKSWAIYTPADGITRYVAKSQIIDSLIEPEVGLRFEIQPFVTAGRPAGLVCCCFL